MLLYLNGLLDLKLIDVIDILLVAILLYQFYNLIKGTGAINIFLGIVSLYIIWKVVKALHMSLLGEILDAFVNLSFIALIVVFQPEIRRFLLMLGKPNIINNKHRRFLFWRIRFSKAHALDIDPLVIAAEKMSKNLTGGLIVLALHHELQEVIDTGETLDARISAELIENIFFKNSPLHDGAMLIRDNHIIAARCILPVPDNHDIPVNLGLRHRAAIGLTEQSDAIAIVISEQTGKISLCKNGEIKQGLQPSELKNMLSDEFSNQA